jgi:hypothetical protein
VGLGLRTVENPKQLRVDLEEMIEQEREGARGDPKRETKAWLDELVEVDRKRDGYIDLAAEGIIDRDELRAKLTSLEETRKTARRELEALDRRQEKIEELGRDKDALLEYYAGMVPEALDSLTSEERRQIYKSLRLEVTAGADGTIEVTGTFGEGLDVCKVGPSCWRCRG